MASKAQPATTPQLPASLALEPGCEWKLGDRVVGTGSLSKNDPPYIDSGILFVCAFEHALEGNKLFCFFNSLLSEGHDAARCEWRVKVDCYERATDREYTDWATVRMIWRRDAPLELDVWLGGGVLPSIETQHWAEEVRLVAEVYRLLGEAPPEGMPTVSLLTAMRIADVLQDDASDWVVHP